MDEHDDDASEEEGYEVGRGKPPVHSRFKPGVSGNRRGRPKGRKQQIPYDSVLGKSVSVFEGNHERSVTAAEAFLLYLQRRWAEGDTTARRLIRKALEVRKDLRSVADDTPPEPMRIGFLEPGSPNGAFLPLKMGVKHDRDRPTARILIEPWLVQASLDRIGDRRPTRDEQEAVVKATRTPSKVKWPDWWEVQP